MALKACLGETMMGYRAARVAHVVLMIWVTLLFLFGWLPLMRSLMDGPSYEWGATLLGRQFGGAGLGGDLWYLGIQTAIGLAFLWFGWRRPNGRFRWTLVALLALMLADTLYNVATAPDRFRFRGDTLGMDVSLVLIAPLFDGAMLLLAVWWARTAPTLRTSPLGSASKVFLAIAVLMLPVQYLFLSAGQGQEADDVVGVLLTIGGWFLISAALAPWRSRSRFQRLRAT